MTNDKLQMGVKALRSGNKREARRLLGAAVKENADNAAAWWYLAKTLDDKPQIVHCLKQVLRLEPHHDEARTELERLSRGLGKATTSGNFSRPVLDTTPDGAGLAIAEDFPVAQPRTARASSEISGRLWIAIGLAAITLAIGVVVVILILVGLGSNSPGLRTATTVPTPRSLTISVENCASATANQAELQVINSTESSVDVYQGVVGEEVYLVSLPPGASDIVQLTPDTQIRISVRSTSSEVHSSGLIVEIPAGNSCQMPIKP
jgi:hypothetical protein